MNFDKICNEIWLKILMNIPNNNQTRVQGRLKLVCKTWYNIITSFYPVSLTRNQLVFNLARLYKDLNIYSSLGPKLKTLHVYVIRLHRPVDFSASNYQEYFRKVLLLCPNLTYIWINTGTNNNVAPFLTILSQNKDHLPKLKRLDINELEQCSKYTITNYLNILISLKHTLTELQIRSLKAFRFISYNFGGLNKFLSQLPYLEDLSLIMPSRAFRISLDFIGLFENHPYLKSFEFLDDTQSVHSLLMPSKDGRESATTNINYQLKNLTITTYKLHNATLQYIISTFKGLQFFKLIVLESNFRSQEDPSIKQSIDQLKIFTKNIERLYIEFNFRYGSRFTLRKSINHTGSFDPYLKQFLY
ncbi:uncharacterized protein BX663DRAFT_548282 [Cokeromyces recurvatus]|uniref:uncharacterized protein n=1 Tax=Cokeromyces recurvatus TaxID=90255 RepID=UPI00221F93E6|nr:uncharacterized protein BX663DRAFT_548282 [Cokeromyces recurvatus]KAI7907215.1 hypothetical protein BX663DRAFT_548282 [Cokeromyces recurvatus]